jgi:O-antigen/teichoic acid export membrane protein
MLDYLRRLATTGIAYTGASVVSKLFSVALLPVYTTLIPSTEYGKAEVLFAGVVAASIVVRFGLIEALLRFYYLPNERGEDVVRTGFAGIFWAVTAVSVLALPLAGPVADVIKSDASLVRIAIGGLWLLTLYEYLLTLLRIDERAKAYFVFTFVHVLVAIPLTLILILGADMEASALLLGSYASGIPFVLYLVIAERRRLGLIPDRPLSRRMLRFGLPTMPAELSLYSLNFADRLLFVLLLGAASGNAAAGVYAVAFKFSQSVQIIARGFQLAWPPLAYSIQDDDEARRTYAVVVSAFTALCAMVVCAVWLEARWIVDILAPDPDYADAYKAVGLLVAGSALNGIYLALLVVLGRTGRTEFNFPATLAALVVNIGLNLWLIPEEGIVGAGIAFLAAYATAVVLMYVFTQRLFPVPYEWWRLSAILFLTSATIAAGELLLPTEGFDGFLLRAVAAALLPALLWFVAMRPAERRAVRKYANREAITAKLNELRERRDKAEAEGDRPDEGLEAETLDRDIRDQF